MTNRFFFILPVLALVFIGCPNPDDDKNGNNIFKGKIAFEDRESVKIIDLETGRLREISNLTDPFVKPNGNIIAVIPSKGLFEFTSEGQQVRRIVEQKELAPYYNDAFRFPQLSPDGRFIAYEGSTSIENVFVIDAQSGALVATIGDNNSERYGRPQWLPTGELTVEGRAAKKGIYRVSNDFGVGPRIDRMQTPHHHAVSPDGSMVAAVQNGEIWLMNIDGSNAKMIWNATTPGDWPTWSKDSKYIAVDHDCDIKLIPVHGGMVNSVGGRWNFEDACPHSAQMHWF
jgi:hypothetical protein